MARQRVDASPGGTPWQAWAVGMWLIAGLFLVPQVAAVWAGLNGAGDVYGHITQPVAHPWPSELMTYLWVVGVAWVLLSVTVLVMWLRMRAPREVRDFRYKCGQLA